MMPNAKFALVSSHRLCFVEKFAVMQTRPDPHPSRASYFCQGLAYLSAVLIDDVDVDFFFIDLDVIVDSFKSISIIILL